MTLISFYGLTFRLMGWIRARVRFDYNQAKISRRTHTIGFPQPQKWNPINWRHPSKILRWLWVEGFHVGEIYWCTWGLATIFSRTCFSYQTLSTNKHESTYWFNSNTPLYRSIHYTKTTIEIKKNNNNNGNKRRIINVKAFYNKLSAYV